MGNLHIVNRDLWADAAWHKIFGSKRPCAQTMGFRIAVVPNGLETSKFGFPSSNGGAGATKVVFS